MEFGGTPLRSSSSTGAAGAELGKARELPGSQLPDGAICPAPGAGSAPPALLLPSALPRKRLRAWSSPALRVFEIKTERYRPSGAERGGKLSVGGLRVPRLLLLCPSHLPADRPALPGCSPPSRLSGTRVWGWGAAPTPPRGRGRAPPAGAVARQPGAAARAGLRCAGGAGFFVGCRVTGSH